MGEGGGRIKGRGEEKTHREFVAMGSRSHLLFRVSPLGPADRFDFFHPLLHRRLREEGSLLEFLQNSGAFVLLFEPLERSVDRFILIDNNAYQKYHLLRFEAIALHSWLFSRQVLDKPAGSKFLERHEDCASAA